MIILGQIKEKRGKEKKARFGPFTQVAQLASNTGPIQNRERKGEQISNCSPAAYFLHAAQMRGPSAPPIPAPFFFLAPSFDNFLGRIIVVKLEINYY